MDATDRINLCPTPDSRVAGILLEPLSEDAFRNATQIWCQHALRVAEIEEALKGICALAALENNPESIQHLHSNAASIDAENDTIEKLTERRNSAKAEVDLSANVREPRYIRFGRDDLASNLLCDFRAAS